MVTPEVVRVRRFFPLRAIALGVVVALVAIGCTDDSGSEAKGTSTAATAKYRAFGSINQASVVDAPPSAELVLVNSQGDDVAKGRADRVGSKVFRSVKPGAGYVVEERSGPTTERSTPFEVLNESTKPPQSLYDGQQLKAGLNYMKMRDGVELAATVRLPPGQSLDKGPFPTLIEYSGYEVAPPGDLISSLVGTINDPDAKPDPLAPSGSTAVGGLISPLLGFAVVSLQIRGSGCSGGEFDLFGLPTIYDGYDAVETVAAQPWVKNKKVGMVGISYSGFSQLYVGGTQPPHLAALAPMSVLGDMYDGIGFPGGIFNNGFAEGWLKERINDAKPAPKGGQPWARILIEKGDKKCAENQKLRLQTQDVLDVLAKSEYRDPALYSRRTPADWAEKINVPVFLVGGLQDEQLGSHWANMISRLDDNENVWVTLYNGNHNDALGPEILTRWVEFLDLFVADEIPEIPDAVLGLSGVLYEQIGSAAAPKLQQTRFAGTTDLAAARAKFEADPRIRLLMEVGAGPLGPRSLESTAELTYDSWPPPKAVTTRWNLAGDGKLVPEDTEVAEGADTYLSDPDARPVQSADGGGVVYEADGKYTWKPVAKDRGLGYVTAPLESDMLIAGPGSLDLSVSTTDDDADLQVTLTEVRPDGQETYLTSGWLRLSGRKLNKKTSTELYPVHTHLEGDTQLLKPNEAVNARVPIHPVAAWLRAGSRLRVTVLAPGGDVPLWNFRTVEDGKDKVTVNYGGDAGSSLVLPVVPGTPTVTPMPKCETLRGQPCRAYTVALNGG